VAGAKPFHWQTFIAELAIEALARTVLPELARIDQRRILILAECPLEQGFAGKLRGVVR